MQAQIATNMVIQQIRFALADFVPGSINMTVQVADGTVGIVLISVEEADGYAVFQIDSMAVDGGAAPASYVDVINEELMDLLVGSLDALIEQKVGAGHDLVGITVTDTGIVVEVVP